MKELPRKKRRQRVGAAGQKILLLLLGGLALGLSGSPTRYMRILRTIRREWREIDRHELYRAIRRLYQSKLLKCVEHPDGSTEMMLTREGERIALRYKIDELCINRSSRWDGKWRVIIFDIPEKMKYLRDMLRDRLRQLGLAELQKSVFVHPYECRNEIDFVIEYYNIRRFVRFIEATYIDNELHLKKRFDLL